MVINKNILYSGVKEITQQGITKNFSVLVLAQFGYKLISFVTFIIIARGVGVESFGKLSYAVSFAAIFIYFIDFGMSNLMIKEAAGQTKDKTRNYLNNILTLKLILALLLYSAAILTAIFVEKQKIIFVSILVLGLSYILDSYSASFKSTFNLFEKFNYSAISVICEGLLKFLLILCLKLFLKMDILSISLIFLLTSVIILVLNSVLTWVKFIKFEFSLDAKFIVSIFKSSIPIAFLTLFPLLTFKIDTIMLSKMTNDVITGWFAGASRLIEPIAVIPVTFGVAAFPVISRFYKNSKDNLVSIFTASNLVLSMAAIPIVLILFFCSGFFVQSLLGKEFFNSIMAVKLLSFCLLPIFLRPFLEYFILALGAYKIIYISCIMGVIINISLNLALIPVFAHLGACISTILSELAVVVCIIFMVVKHFIMDRAEVARL
ncbi:MAG: flippase [Candidatus Omnitrophota bacterium]